MAKQELTSRTYRKRFEKGMQTLQNEGISDGTDNSFVGENDPELARIGACDEVENLQFTGKIPSGFHITTEKEISFQSGKRNVPDQYTARK